MPSCDVLIVGGGPAGSSAAWKLRDSGLDVLILDKKTFPRDKTCAGWITPAVVDELQLDLDAYRAHHVCQPINGFRTGLIGGEEVETDYGRTVSYGIRRCEFDHYLLERSRARCRLGEPLRTMEHTGRGYVVNGEIEAAVIVGAGGHFCPVARFLGSRCEPNAPAARRGEPGASATGAPVVAAQEIEFEADPDDLRRGSLEAERPELFFCEDLMGYGWCFRKGNYLNIGLGRVDHGRLAGHVRSFWEFLRERNKVCCPPPERFHGHAYRLYEHSEPRLLDDGVLLVGDAAGLAYPQSGEGIRPAVESGLIAAEVILAAASNYSRDRLEPYRARITERFGKPRTTAASQWLPAGWLHFLASRLLASRWFSRHVVLDRWFLHVDEPALAETVSHPSR